MPKAPTKEGGMKVLTASHEKAVFIEAAKKARQSLSAWLIQAAVERASREGFEIVEPKKGAKR